MAPASGPSYVQGLGSQTGARAYLRAMAELGPGPVRSAEVASLLGRKTTALGPTRDGLIKKPLCYSPRWGEIDFTVSMFDEFMKRWIPDLTKLDS